ncbi:MAG TPA: NmrA family NAD(P)-binding protein [Stellaceae bacterium]|nr:NmrA family NAD(P)-binding protein [Stellaceae bacterium]
MYAIMGVTGKVGGALARQLLDDGIKIRAILRDAAKGGTWWDRGAEVALADLEDPKTLGEALAGAAGVFVMLPPDFDPAPGFPEARQRISHLRQAILLAMPPKVVVLSTIGAEAKQPNLLNQLGLLEQALGDLPMPVTFLRAAWFMENAALDVPSARDEGVIHSYLQPLDRRVPMISAVDVGHMAAALLQEDWTGARVVALEAERRVSPLDIAQAFSRTLGRPVEAEAVPRENWEAIFRDAGMQNPSPRMQMIDGFNEGWIDFADRGAHARKGATGLDEAIAALVK